MPEPAFTIVYDSAVLVHLAGIERRYHSLIRSHIEQQLMHEPGIQTRNRKPYGKSMTFGEAWELRCGLGNRFRVFYRIDAERRQVRVLAILVKVREKLYAGDEVFEP